MKLIRGCAPDRSGAHLGYRLLRPCVTCSISRPAYSYSSYNSNNNPSYASAAAPPPPAPPANPYFRYGTANDNNDDNDDNDSNPYVFSRSAPYAYTARLPPQQASSSFSAAHPQGQGRVAPSLSAGGVTGGGLADGLLFHFRRSSITPLPRYVGVTPSEELDEAKRVTVEFDGGEGEEEEGDEGAEAARMGETERRRREKGKGREKRREDGEGEKMTWKKIPSAQVRLIPFPFLPLLSSVAVQAAEKTNAPTLLAGRLSLLPPLLPPHLAPSRWRNMVARKQRRETFSPSHRFFTRWVFLGDW